MINVVLQLWYVWPSMTPILTTGIETNDQTGTVPIDQFLLQIIHTSSLQNRSRKLISIHNNLVKEIHLTSCNILTLSYQKMESPQMDFV